MNTSGRSLPGASVFQGGWNLTVQDLWLYIILRPHLKRRYQVAIVDGPESALLALFLKKTGRVRFLILLRHRLLSGGTSTMVRASCPAGANLLQGFRRRGFREPTACSVARAAGCQIGSIRPQWGRLCSLSCGQPNPPGTPANTYLHG